MKNPVLSKSDVKPALCDVLASWADAGQLEFVSAMPPIQSFGGVKVVPLDKGLLKRPGDKITTPRVSYWTEEGLNAGDTIRFGIVLKGEVDIRVGVTEQMAQHDARLRNGPGLLILQLQPRVAFHMPPGLPVVDGYRPHWERPGLGDANSEIFWIDVRNHGVRMHMCRTSGVRHESSGSVMVVDTQLSALAQMINEESSTHSPYSSEIARTLFQAFLLRAAQSFTLRGSFSPMGERQRDSSDVNETAANAPRNFDAEVVHKACRYMRTYHYLPLTLEKIAIHAFVSPTHLNRLFRSELNTSVKRYLTQQRVETAQALLRETDMSVLLISRTVGYAHASHLSQVFARVLGTSPTAYRLSHRKHEGPKIR